MEHRKLSNVAAKSYFRGEERGFDRLVLRLAIILATATVALYGIYILQNIHAARPVPKNPCVYSSASGYAVCSLTKAGTEARGLSGCERWGHTKVICSTK